MTTAYPDFTERPASYRFNLISLGKKMLLCANIDANTTAGETDMYIICGVILYERLQKRKLFHSGVINSAANPFRQHNKTR